MLQAPAPRDDGKSSPGGPWRSYKERLARLAQRLVDAQRPIRILNAVKWDPTVFERFRESRWRKMPTVDAEYYRGIPLGFDPDATITEMRAIERQVRLELGDDAVGLIVAETARQFTVYEPFASVGGGISATSVNGSFGSTVPAWRALTAGGTADAWVNSTPPTSCDLGSKYVGFFSSVIFWSCV